MRLTDAYAANPLCSPTRASILTGLYPERLKITQPHCHLPPGPTDGKALTTGPGWAKTGVVKVARYTESGRGPNRAPKTAGCSQSLFEATQNPTHRFDVEA